MRRCETEKDVVNFCPMKNRKTIRFHEISRMHPEECLLLCPKAACGNPAVVVAAVVVFLVLS